MTVHHNGHCLEDGEIYEYLTGSPAAAQKSNIESHLSRCANCRQELAQLLRILNPEQAESSEIAQESSPQEIRNMVAFVQKVSRNESKKRSIYRWGSIAAAAIIAIALSSAGFTYLYVKIKAQNLCNQGRSLLQAVYEPRSPSDLRLDLPFRSEVSQRAASESEEASSGAEKYFNQAIGVREGTTEAHLALGYLHLKKGQFSYAEREFQAVLDNRDMQAQALIGRGVSRFEGGLASANPIARSGLMKGALADFEGVLRLNPGSNEALYDKVQVLYQVGRHQEALQGIEAYLARDPDSLWAAKLRDLKMRIQMNRSELLERDVDRAALARDARTLQSIVAAVVPSKIPSMVSTLVHRALDLEGLPAPPRGSPDKNDLQWAARSMASFYQSATGDASSLHLLDFYAGLSPPQRQLKKIWDAQLEQLITLFGANDFKSPLDRSRPLINGYKKLRDYRQLARVYQLRASCLAYGKTDFAAALAESLEMLRYAEATCSPDFVARSISYVASNYADLHQYDRALAYYSLLKRLAEWHHMDDYSVFASTSLGNLYLSLNQLEQSEREFAQSLKLAYRVMEPQPLVWALGYLGTVMERMKRYDEAGNLYSESAQWQSTFIREGLLKPSPEADVLRMNWLNRQGYFALWKKDLRKAEASFREALKGSSDKMHELEARNRLGLAQVYFQENRYRESEAEVQAALNSSSKNHYPESAWQSNSLLGALRKQRGDDAGALQSFRKAAEVIEELRANVPLANLRQSFFDRRFDPYRQIVSLLYHSNSPEEALQYVDRAKAMNLREFLSMHSDSSNANSDALKKQNSETRSALPPGIVTLEYFLSADEVFMFVSGPGGTDAASAGIPLDEIQGMVRQYIDCLGTGRGSPAVLSRRLHKELIEPVLSKLENRFIETLVVIPDGPLHLLPFGSLMDSQGRYLIEKYAISYAPSRSALHHCFNKRRAGRITPESSILLMDGSSNLPGASRELAFLAKLYSKHHRLVTAADLASAGAIIRDYEIIHFSGHSTLYQGSPRLVFHGSQGEAYLDSSAIRDLRLRKNQLVSLAGCSTATGPLFDGETPWGLVPSFLSAGAPTLLLSLVPVDDAATSRLTSEFYDILAHHPYSKAQALRLAQLSLLKQSRSNADKKLLYWAPFVIVGDPR